MTLFDKPRTPPSIITCPQCHRVSHNPEDIKQKYCGACHEYTSDPAVMVAKASRLYMTNAELHHIVTVADRMVDVMSSGGRSSNRGDRMEVIVAALAMVLGGWDTERAIAFRKAQHDALAYGDGFMRVKADGSCEVLHPTTVMLHSPTPL